MDHLEDIEERLEDDINKLYGILSLFFGEKNTEKIEILLKLRHELLPVEKHGAKCAANLVSLCCFNEIEELMTGLIFDYKKALVLNIEIYKDLKFNSYTHIEQLFEKLPKGKRKQKEILEQRETVLEVIYEMFTEQKRRIINSAVT